MHNVGPIKFDSGDGVTVSLYFVDVANIETNMEELLSLLRHRE